jgi:TonB family protein
LLFSTFFLYFPGKTIIETTNNNAKINILHSFIYQKINSQSKKQKSLKMQIKNVATKKIILNEKKPQKMQASTTANNQNTNNIKNSDNMNLSELAQKIHDLVAENIIYPAETAELIKNKEVVLIFTLFSDGIIENAKIAKSSGINVLDDAALSALKEISPIAIAKEYLVTQKEFQVTVKYR